MSVYNIISKNTITSPFIQFTKEQDIVASQINHIFHKFLTTNQNNKKISDNIKNIKSLIDNNNIIYNNEKIVLFNFVELMIYENNHGYELLVKVLHPANLEYLTILDCIYVNYSDFLHAMSTWKRIFNKFNGIEFQIPINTLNEWKKKILTGQANDDEIIIPFHDHFKKYLSGFSDLMNKNLDDFKLNIIFESTDISRDFKYTINFFDGNENYIIFHKVVVEKNNIDFFLKQLFFYGKL